MQPYQPLHESFQGASKKQVTFYGSVRIRIQTTEEFVLTKRKGLFLLAMAVPGLLRFRVSGFRG